MKPCFNKSWRASPAPARDSPSCSTYGPVVKWKRAYSGRGRMTGEVRVGRAAHACTSGSSPGEKRAPAFVLSTCATPKKWRSGESIAPSTSWAKRRTIGSLGDRALSLTIELSKAKKAQKTRM